MIEHSGSISNNETLVNQLKFQSLEIDISRKVRG